MFSYVIMSNHMHMICRRKDKDLNELLGRFKSYTAKKMLAEINSNLHESRKDWLIYLFQYFAKLNKQYSTHHIWHYSNHPTHLYTPEVANQKRDYIHQNPVRAGIVVDEASYLYSSACPESPLKVLDW
jgi:putative transposase